LYKEFYPKLYAHVLDWLSAYIQTYVEIDVRQLINIRHLKKFQTFLKLCAAHVGQIINYTALSNAVSVNGKTVKEWLSILEATYIVYMLQPYYKNFKKSLLNHLSYTFMILC